MNLFCQRIVKAAAHNPFFVGRQKSPLLSAGVRQIELIYRTIADKVRQDILKSLPDKYQSCRRFDWIHRTPANKWRFFVRRWKIGCVRQADDPTNFQSADLTKIKKKILLYDEKSGNVRWPLIMRTNQTQQSVKNKIDIKSTGTWHGKQDSC